MLKFIYSSSEVQGLVLCLLTMNINMTPLLFYAKKKNPDKIKCNFKTISPNDKIYFKKFKFCHQNKTIL